tara:strand:+ start:271 stop:522 length:252 start_codon:yes stop_codon:yes gene_type:complete
MRHFPEERREAVAELFVKTITCWGPPIATKAPTMVSRVLKNGPDDIVEVVRANRVDALEAADFWLDWWESLITAQRRRRCMTW